MYKPEHTEPFYKLIGEIAVTYARSEVNSAVVLNFLTGLSIGADIFANKSFNAEQKIKEYKRALDKTTETNEEFKERFYEILIELDKCRIERNKIVHAAWSNIPRTGYNWTGMTLLKTGEMLLMKPKDAEDLLVSLKRVSDRILLMMGRVATHKK
jgi:hypothetical protein